MPSQLLASFTQNGVQVDIHAEADSDDNRYRTLVATFSPLTEHYHLYAKSLPRDGIVGIGRPTFIEVISPSGVRSSGDLQEDVASFEQYIEGFSQPFSVYPEGRVTLRQRVEWLSDIVKTPLPITYLPSTNKV